MAALPTNRTTANTPAEHVTDHNTLHADHNLLEGGSNGQVLTKVAGVAAWAAPSGSDVWGDFTPTWTGITLGNGTSTGRYTQSGKTVHVYARLIFGSTTSVSAAIRLGLPVAAKASTHQLLTALYVDSGTRNWVGVANIGQYDATTAVCLHTEATSGETSSTAPFTWGTNDYIDISGTYEAA